MTGRSREWVSEIRSAAERATALTGQLLAFSRKQILKPATLELNDLLLNLENMLKRLIGEDIHLLISCSPLVKPVLADPSQLEQVVLNLVVNACDAMPTGGKLRIETEQVTAGALLASHHGVPPGTYVELSVSDTGCGMDEETLGSIFEPFFTTKPQGKGTGLGLSTVYGIVKQSGGYVWAESQINQGTTIRILLPESPEATTQAGIAGADGRFEGGRETILVVEDEEALRLLIQSSLDRLGYTVHSAASCPAALGVVGREGRIDLVITDILMPGGSGLELVNQLRHLHPNVKVLFMSGYSDAAIDRHGSLEPDIPLLVKPFGIKTLIKTVRRLFDPDG
jgi:CheY-like chemotaxis protein